MVYKPPGMQTMYLQAKGSKRGRKKGAPSGGFTVALFLALFGLVPLLYLEGKTGWKTKICEKGRKKGAKKGGKMATVNVPIASQIKWLGPERLKDNRHGLSTTEPIPALFSTWLHTQLLDALTIKVPFCEWHSNLRCAGETNFKLSLLRPKRRGIRELPNGSGSIRTSVFCVMLLSGTSESYSVDHPPQSLTPLATELIRCTNF
ncbi:hypothetical protein C8F04DRAFT_1197004 [Mycena alexandri]|uniref:Uncharacterized protein n=1 Tax=Mycena alexandri TaxID=1745969 RepID=A0AAD6WP93_9AGAR|nr:hypothetical protein C8F04DRAFT_1197004 [Mycena alexandri]